MRVKNSQTKASLLGEGREPALSSAVVRNGGCRVGQTQPQPLTPHFVPLGMLQTPSRNCRRLILIKSTAGRYQVVSKRLMS